MLQLTIGQQMLTIAVILLVPLVALGRIYWSIADSRRDFSAKEQLGIEQIQPVSALLIAVTGARVTRELGTTADTDAIETALDQVAALDPRGLDIATELDQVIASTQAALADQDWQAAINGTLALAAVIGNNSNLMLDPDLDSFYVMDALVVKVPALADVSTRVEAAIGEGDTSTDALLTLSLDAGALGDLTKGLTGDVETALAATTDTDLAQELSAATNALATQLTANAAIANAMVAASLNDEPVASASAKSSGPALAELSRSLATGLDRLIETRIAGFDAEVSRARTTVIVGLSVALVLVLTIIRSTRRASRAVVASLEALAAGRFVASHVARGRHELSRMSAALDCSIDTTRDTMERIHTAAATVRSSAAELNQSSAELLDNAGRASEHAGIAAAGIEELRASIDEIGRNSTEATMISQNAAALAGDSRANMEQLRDHTSSVAAMAAAIAQIAEQTNLLALNATIEAARAGEAGRGFAVVATEVKTLAVDTQQATESVSMTARGMQEVTEATWEQVSSNADSLGVISYAQSSIAAAIEQQSATTEELSRSLQSLADTSSQASVSAERFAELAAGLNDSGQELLDELSKFQLD